MYCAISDCINIQPNNKVTVIIQLGESVCRCKKNWDATSKVKIAATCINHTSWIT